jgi:hypothetical protein
VPDLDSFIQRLSEHKSPHKPASESVASSIGINNLALGKFLHLMDFWLVWLGRRNYCRGICTTSDDYDAWARRVGFWQERYGTRDGDVVFRIWEPSSATPCLGFRFIANYVVRVRDDTF